MLAGKLTALYAIAGRVTIGASRPPFSQLHELTLTKDQLVSISYGRQDLVEQRPKNLK